MVEVIIHSPGVADVLWFVSEAAGQGPAPLVKQRKEDEAEISQVNKHQFDGDCHVF